MEVVENGYKMTEVGMIPSEWTILQIGELYRFKNGLNKASEYFGYGTPIVNYMDVFTNYGIKAKDVIGKVFVNSDEKNNFSARKGDVFFTRTSETVDEIGISAVLEEEIKDCVFSGFILRARPLKDTITIEYAKYCFLSQIVRSQIISKASYTTRALTNGRHLSQVKLPIPPVSEQKAIATALSDVDALISSLDKLIEKKKAIKQGAMQELLTPPDQGGNWQKLVFSEFCDVRDGTHDSPTYVDHGVKFVTSKNLVNNRLSLDDITHISEFDAIEINKRSKVDKGDILMSMIGTIGNAAYLEDEPDFCIKNVALLKPIKGRVDPIFFYHKLISPSYQQFILGKLDGGIQKFISLGMLRNLEIDFPVELGEQRAIATIISNMDSEIQLLESKREKYKLIKQGMMQELLTGKTRLI